MAWFPSALGRGCVTDDLVGAAGGAGRTDVRDTSELHDRITITPPIPRMGLVCVMGKPYVRVVEPSAAGQWPIVHDTRGRVVVRAFANDEEE